MKGFLMWCLIGLAVAAGLWQVQHSDPLIPRALAAALLFAIGGVCGLRIGAEGRSRLVQDLTRLNKYLIEQNSQLSEHNLSYLKKLSPEASGEPVEPGSREV